MRPTTKTSEGDHQLRLMRWAAKQALTIPETGLLFHIPNGGARDRSTAARLKVEGVKAGVPDLFLPVPRKGFHGLWIELKTHGGKASDEQNAWIGRLTAQGYYARVIVGADAAYRLVVDYLGLHGHPGLLTLDREPVAKSSPNIIATHSQPDRRPF